MIALKRLHSTREEDFNVEVEVLKAFTNRPHPHLVKLLATFRWKGRYYLMFPYANANLRKYWESTPTPEFTPITIAWSLQQCKGIASGLMAIHEYRTSLVVGLPTSPSKAHSRRGSENLGSSLVPEGPEKKYGRHGDIKPENILWSDEYLPDENGKPNDLGLLLIADFGLMDFHGRQTRSEVLPEGSLALLHMSRLSADSASKSLAPTISGA